MVISKFLMYIKFGPDEGRSFDSASKQVRVSVFDPPRVEGLDAVRRQLRNKVRQIETSDPESDTGDEDDTSSDDDDSVNPADDNDDSSQTGDAACSKAAEATSGSDSGRTQTKVSSQYP